MKRIIDNFLVLNSAQNQSGEIHIEGDISDSGWEWDDDVSPKKVIDSLKEVGNVKNLDVYVNSFGGSCVAGNSIVSIIDNYKLKNKCTVNVYIRGIAASMGSGIAMVGDKVSMASNALFMIHKPSVFSYGNANDLEKDIEILNKTEKTLISNYMRKFNGTEEELKDLMAEETWLTADEAKEYGFVDEITDEVEIAACAKGIKINNSEFGKNIVDVINKKYPNAKIKEKEEKTLEYNESLKDFGIGEDLFNSVGVDSEKVMQIANAVKDAVHVEPVEQFVDKESVCQKLGCEDITADELIDLAIKGNAPDNSKELQNKATMYDKIVADARASAKKSAIRALGDYYNESRIGKMLDALDYSEIVEQTDAWEKQACDVLHAGERVSVIENEPQSASINPADSMI